MYIIYFVTDLQNIKIGFTNQDIKKRIQQLSTGNSSKIYLIGFRQGSINDEKYLHTKFMNEKSHGEWFKPVKEILDYINIQNEMNHTVECEDGKLMIYKKMKC